jgi:hypothetical protein
MCKIQYLQLLVLISGVVKTRKHPGRQPRGHADRYAYATGIVCARCSITVLGAAGGVAVGTVALERAPMSREHDPREPGA